MIEGSCHQVGNQRFRVQSQASPGNLRPQVALNNKYSQLKFARCQDGYVEHVPDYHSCSLGLTPAWGNLKNGYRQVDYWKLYWTLFE